MSSSMKEFEKAFLFVRNLPYKMPVSIGVGGLHKTLALLLIIYINLNDLPVHKLLRMLIDQCGMKKSYSKVSKFSIYKHAIFCNVTASSYFFF